jgi:hypothetical protein
MNYKYSTTFLILFADFIFGLKAQSCKLSNGFTYYIHHNEASKQRGVIYLVNKVAAAKYLNGDNHIRLVLPTEKM